MPTGLDYLIAFRERALAAPLMTEGIAGLPTEPDYLRTNNRFLQVIDTPPPVNRRETYTVQQAREIARQAILDYTDLVQPEHMLLVKMQPGTGKSHIAAGIAGYLAAHMRRVFWAAPRHDYIYDLRALAAKQGYNPAHIYEWQPRQAGNEEQGKEETCLHVEPISKWMARGYEGRIFCQRICGWDFMNKSCAYHAQKQRMEPIIMGVHQHITLGHPMEFEVVIGDESPLATFVQPWVIPARFVMPPDMDREEPLTEIMHRLRTLCDSGTLAQGEDLLNLLGGAQNVYEACNTFWLKPDAKIWTPPLFRSEDVENAPYFHLPHLVPLLQREADAALTGRKYNKRVIVNKGELILMQRREVNKDMNKHVIWLDATGDERLYRQMFRRPVQVVEPYVALQGRIVQVTGRGNNKTSFQRRTTAEDSDEETYELDPARIDQLVTQIRRIIDTNKLQKPGVITYKAVAAEIAKRNIPGIRLLHFYAARGANSMEDVDGLIVAGTPQPNKHELENLAKMLFFERMDAFVPTFTAMRIPYQYTDSDGKGRDYPIVGFWHDQDLQATLWQQRDAELVQAVHRARIINRPVTVWLLSNLPIDELPPSEIIDVRDLFGAPPDTDIFLWAQVISLAETIGKERGFVTTVDLIERLNLNRRTAYKYIEQLAARDGWDLGAVRNGKVGKPAKAAFHAQEMSSDLY